MHRIPGRGNDKYKGEDENEQLYTRKDQRNGNFADGGTTDGSRGWHRRGYRGRLLSDFFDQVRGQYYFTHERVAFVSGWGTNSFSIKYSAIKGIKKSFIGPFLPFGVTVTAETEDGKTKKYKFSLLGRAKWIDFLSNKSGISVG